MKTFIFTVFAVLSLAAQAEAKSCIPSSSNPGGCMGVPNELTAQDERSFQDDEFFQARDSGGNSGRDSGGSSGEGDYYDGE